MFQNGFAALHAVATRVTHGIAWDQHVVALAHRHHRCDRIVPFSDPVSVLARVTRQPAGWGHSGHAKVAAVLARVQARHDPRPQRQTGWRDAQRGRKAIPKEGNALLRRPPFPLVAYWMRAQDGAVEHPHTDPARVAKRRGTHHLAQPARRRAQGLTMSPRRHAAGSGQVTVQRGVWPTRNTPTGTGWPVAGLLRCDHRSVPMIASQLSTAKPEGRLRAKPASPAAAMAKCTRRKPSMPLANATCSRSAVRVYPCLPAMTGYAITGPQSPVAAREGILPGMPVPWLFSSHALPPPPGSHSRI